MREVGCRRACSCPFWRRAGLIPLRGCRAKASAERPTLRPACRDLVRTWRQVRPVAIEAMRCIPALHLTRPRDLIFAAHWLDVAAGWFRGRAGELFVRRPNSRGQGHASYRTDG